MQALDRGEVSVHMDAQPAEVYGIVADVTRTPEFSPEVKRCAWLDGATGPKVGARFKAHNKVQRGPGWSNKPVITAADPGREFAFSRTEFGGGTMQWRYLFEPDGAGTRVTESYEVVRPLSAFMWFVIERVCGRKDRRSDLRLGMQQTLEGVRVVVERSPHLT
ncbi:MAG TPA: SRPBCC family protein [Mycobacteriales bacterium]|nr:SRPBCC family protein [Mycobacteriales bacterium]